MEYKLKSVDEEERYRSVSLLASMFSEKDSNVAINHMPLWEAFLGRFNDVNIKIRTKCVQYSLHFLLNHPPQVGKYKLSGEVFPSTGGTLSPVCQRFAETDVPKQAKHHSSHCF